MTFMILLKTINDLKSVRGRIPVEKDLRINGYKNVFVIGDCSAFMNE